MFGFLYDFSGNDKISIVNSVEDTVEQVWFREAIESSQADAIVVLAHMDLRDKLVTVILNRIRKINPTIPVCFLTGHTHYRGFAHLDSSAISLESGHYFDTVGWLSFSLAKTNGNKTNSGIGKNSTQSNMLTFHHKFIDANKESLAEASGVPEDQFPTSAGKLLTTEIEHTRHALGLDTVQGCSPETFELSADFEKPTSLWGLYMGSVVPSELFQPQYSQTMCIISSIGSHSENVFVVHSYTCLIGGFRYNFFKGKVTKDDCYKVSPFRDNYNIVGSVPLRSIRKGITDLNTNNVLTHRTNRWYSSLCF